MWSGLNGRDRFKRIMQFKKPDRIPLWHIESITEETIRLWTLQGFPFGMRFEDYFRFDSGSLLHEAVLLDFGPIPSFVGKTLCKDLQGDSSEYVTRINRYGYVEQRSRRVPYRGYHYIDPFPIKEKQDWDKLKERYDPRDIRRYPKCWGDDFIQYCNDAEFPVGLRINYIPGRGPKGGYGMGVQKYLTTIFKDPDFIHDIFSFWADFTIEIVKKAVRSITFDYVNFADDGIAAANGPMVSPRIYKEFYFPYQKKVNDFLRGNGVEVICWYGSGNIEPLIPLMLKSGFNCFAPLECAAGMDAVELRKEYGQQIFLIGNISRQALMEGKRSIEDEFYSKVPYLMNEGGYIPALDDIIMPDIPFENYKHYINLVRHFKL